MALALALVLLVCVGVILRAWLISRAKQRRLAAAYVEAERAMPVQDRWGTVVRTANMHLRPGGGRVRAAEPSRGAEPLPPSDVYAPYGYTAPPTFGLADAPDPAPAAPSFHGGDGGSAGGAGASGSWDAPSTGDGGSYSGGDSGGSSSDGGGGSGGGSGD